MQSTNTISLQSIGQHGFTDGRQPALLGGDEGDGGARAAARHRAVYQPVQKTSRPHWRRPEVGR